jgi:TonB family protein
MSVILPPTAPSSVRGHTVELRLTVDERGAVRQVDVMTPTGDRGFDNRLRRTAMDWRFQPARDRDNRAVPAQVPISFSF